MTTANRRSTTGVWVHYHLDDYYKPHADTLHAEEIDARRAAMDSIAGESGKADVVFVPWDSDIEACVQAGHIASNAAKPTAPPSGPPRPARPAPKVPSKPAVKKDAPAAKTTLQDGV